jgi:hypothetical protein
MVRGARQLSADPLEAAARGWTRKVAHEEWLRTLAEVAVALAGFSGLLAGIRQRSQRESRINITRLRTIVETSLSVLAFSLLPALLNGLGLNDVGAFRISAVSFLAGFIPLTVRGFRRFRVAHGGAALSSSPLLGATYLVSVTALVAGVGCAVGLPRSAVPTLYLVALAGTLAIGALNFLGFAIEYSGVESTD